MYWKHIKFNDLTLETKELECKLVAKRVKEEYLILGGDVDLWNEFVERVRKETGLDLSVTINGNTITIFEI